MRSTGRAMNVARAKTCASPEERMMSAAMCSLPSCKARSNLQARGSSLDSSKLEVAKKLHGGGRRSSSIGCLLFKKASFFSSGDGEKKEISVV